MARHSPLYRRLAFWALAGVAQLASHDLVYVVQVGPGEALAQTLRQAGHGYWGIASTVLGAIGAVAAIATFARFRRLRRTARRLSAPHLRTTDSYASRWGANWSRLLGIVLVGFLLQENAEHWLQHGHAPGLGAIAGPEYPLAIPVIAMTTAVAALFAALVRRAEADLLHRISAALSRLIGQGPTRLERPALHVRRPRLSPLGQSAAGRAPPRELVSVT